jgi:NADPH:quinone reductase-like Zn-dependent oxidoreductase
VLKLQQLPRPEIAPDEVLIALQASTPWMVSAPR